jgi:hypothetical protein
VACRFLSLQKTLSETAPILIIHLRKTQGKYIWNI